MPPVSQLWADFLYNVSNIALVVGAVAVLLGTIGTVWMGSIKEWYSDQRIMANEAKTADANKVAGEANERAANAIERAGTLEKDARLAEQRTAELNLQIERMRAGRQLSPGKRQELLVASAKYAGLKFDASVAGSDPEATAILTQIEDVLTQAGWVQQAWMGAVIVIERQGRPIVGIASNFGITILYAQEEWGLFYDASAMLKSIMVASEIKTDISVETWKGGNEGGMGPQKGVLHILVGKKPL